MNEYHAFHYWCDNDALEVKEKVLKDAPNGIIVNGDNVICKEQVFSALDRALKAQNTGKMVAKTLAVEFFLQLTGNHQIKEALKITSIEKNTKLLILLSKEELMNSNLEQFENGIPEFNYTSKLKSKYSLKSENQQDGCKEIISRGVRFVVDHE